MNEYTVNMSIEAQGYSTEFDIKVDAYSEEEAKEAAVSQVDDNFIVLVSDVESDFDPDDEDDEPSYDVTVEVTYGAHTFEIAKDILTDDENDAKEIAVSTTRDNTLVFAHSATLTEA